MILYYLSHKKMIMNGSGLKVIGTASTIAYSDIIESFQNKKHSLISSDDNYDPLDIVKDYDFIGDPILNENVLDKYMPLILRKYIESLDEDNRNKIIKAYHNLEAIIQDSLLLETLPLELDFSEDMKKFLKLENLHLDTNLLKEPYAIIETILNIHQMCDLNSVPVFCNVAHYLDKAELVMLDDLLKSMNLKSVLIEFSDNKSTLFPERVDYYYIDEDLVDWY
ncbi:type II-A CRISPR-associated protein Csn2 [Lactobacillus hominis]|uniref:CRISPR-associated Csn2 family protein n=1 Tax=Lactobacillus hominis DSM 23910 = CRBIP 24.179 TaxID=1423758 RepID=I7LAG1_9LACO|nr:type II-A CRISPR-associated protein Csn2 [Lactobacillus hominis]KRM84418.1 crispr-associated protein [Lactobacillus hominis DSM 23910 = CRBIP 24.179]MCT3348497.1 type II-A CRISPR-associated protein Csn2 [Lactobacillus hominis]CCI82224.1 CRISPR-associated Csn2 family protein [Lactobacillus hominis DSM 23910 = CRBIP 24.179]